MIGCHYGYATQHLNGKNTVYTVKLWDDVHNILKFAMLNRNWRITKDPTQKDMANRYKGMYSWLFMFGDVLNLVSSAMWIR